MVIKMKYQRIRDLREDSDLTQSQIGEKLNLPQRTYAYYESGERTIPPEILIKLADFYNTSIDYILGRTDIRLKTTGVRLNVSTRIVPAIGMYGKITDHK